MRNGPTQNHCIAVATPVSIPRAQRTYPEPLYCCGHTSLYSSWTTDLRMTTVLPRAHQSLFLVHNGPIQNHFIAAAAPVSIPHAHRIYAGSLYCCGHSSLYSSCTTDLGRPTVLLRPHPLFLRPWINADIVISFMQIVENFSRLMKWFAYCSNSLTGGCALY